MDVSRVRVSEREHPDNLAPIHRSGGLHGLSQSFSCVNQNRYSSSGSSNNPSERVVVCIDGSNLFYAANKLNLEIDYKKLLQQAVAGRSLLRAYFYTGVDPENDRQQGFLLWMKRNGYRVITRDVVTLPNGDKSANLDVEIAVDMFQLSMHCDTIVLFSGDGDLAYAIERASAKGARFEVVSLRSMTSDALLNVADHYVDLAEWSPFIQKSTRSDAVLSTRHNLPSSSPALLSPNLYPKAN